jgi:integrase
MKLTKSAIDKLVCPPGRRDMLVMDGEIKGFGIRVTAGGAKVFLLQYRWGRAVRRIVIGEYGEITPAQARTRAGVLRGEVLAGGDPVGERRARRASDAVDALPLRDLIDAWKTKGLQDRRANYSREAVRALTVNLAAHLDKAASAIGVDQAVRIIDKIEDGRGGPMARRTLAYARAMYGWAVRRRLLNVNPFLGLAAPGKDVARDRVLTDTELAEVWTAMGTMGEAFAACLQLLALTLQRRTEVAGMCWSEISADQAVWTIPAERAKNGRAHLVHLAPAARAILQGIERKDGVPFVFSTTGNTPVSGFAKAKLMLDGKIGKARAERCEPGAKVAPMPGWRFHDLRRTGVTTLARLGTAPHVCDRLLNHVDGSIRGVAAVYQRHDFLAERQTALEAWAAHVLRIAGDVPTPAEG